MVLSTLLTTQAGQLGAAFAVPYEEDDPVKLRFLVRENAESPTFEVVFTAEGSETLAQLKTRALNAIEDAGLEVVSM